MSVAAFLLVLVSMLLLLPACFNDSGDDDDDDAGPIELDDDTTDDDDTGDDDTTDDDDTVDDDTSDDDDDDDGPTRSFHVASAPLQYFEDLDNYFIGESFDFAGFAGNLDAVSLHMDSFFGVPWAQFADEDGDKDFDLPKVWTDAMDQIAADAETLGLPVYLSLTPLDGTRAALAPAPVKMDNGYLGKEPYINGCFDFDNHEKADEIKTAYRNYVNWMIDKFDPTWLTTVIEINIYESACEDEYASLMDFANEIYDMVKAAHPDLPTFPTFVVHFLYRGNKPWAICGSYSRQCLKKELEINAGIKRDRMALSSYPRLDGFRMDDFPEDLYSLIADLTGERLVWAETGWPSGDTIWDLDAGSAVENCVNGIPSDDAEQAAFLEYLFAEAQAQNSDLVTWWSYRDFLPEGFPQTCPCYHEDPEWCILSDVLQPTGLLPAFLLWGQMGMIEHDLDPKSAKTAWDAWRAMPIE
ncbi:MAG: hypothetical protein H6683_09140 [Deltaproteobacteria bacterium]|nr:hypothetical protein [Deltaproteobacteria bacterium]